MSTVKHKTIFWLCLTESSDESQFVSDAMAELLATLTTRPLQLSLDMRQLPDELASILLPHLHAPDIEACVQVLQAAQGSTAMSPPSSRKSACGTG